MRITTAHLATAVALTLTAGLAGCGSSDDAKPVPTPAAAPSTTSAADASSNKLGDVTKIAAGDGNFDLCSTLTVADVAPAYIKTAMPDRIPVSMRSNIAGDRYSDERNGSATCTYADNGSGPGVVLSMPLSEKTSDLKSLVTGLDSLAGPPKDVKVGSDKAVIVESEKRSTIAVQHGENQFVLGWKALNDTLETMDKETMPTEQMIALASKVTAKMPTKASFKRISTPDECKRLNADAIVGKVAVARGSVNDDNLNCAFSGPKGILNIDAANQISDRSQQGAIDVMRESATKFPEVNPPFGPDVTVFSGGSYNTDSGFNYDGFLKDCCEVKFEFTPRDERNGARSADLDKDERKLIGTQFDVLRSWSF